MFKLSIEASVWYRCSVIYGSSGSCVPANAFGANKPFVLTISLGFKVDQAIRLKTVRLLAAEG